MLLLLNRCGNTLLFTGTSFECGMMGSSGVARTLISCLLGQYHSLFPPSCLLMHEHTQSMSHWHLLRLVGNSPAVRTYTCSPGLWHHWEHGAMLLLSSEVNVSYQAVALLAMVSGEAAYRPCPGHPLSLPHCMCPWPVSVQERVIHTVKSAWAPRAIPPGPSKIR